MARKGWFLFQLNTAEADDSFSVLGDDLLSEISRRFLWIRENCPFLNPAVVFVKQPQGDTVVHSSGSRMLQHFLQVNPSWCNK